MFRLAFFHLAFVRLDFFRSS